MVPSCPRAPVSVPPCAGLITTIGPPGTSGGAIACGGAAPAAREERLLPVGAASGCAGGVPAVIVVALQSRSENEKARNQTADEQPKGFRTGIRITEHLS